jgi:hypothetical protein
MPSQPAIQFGEMPTDFPHHHPHIKRRLPGSDAEVSNNTATPLELYGSVR